MKRLNLIPRQKSRDRVFNPQTGFKKPIIKPVLIAVILFGIVLFSRYLLGQQYNWKVASAKKQLDAVKVQLSRLQTERLNLAKEYEVLTKKKAIVDAKLGYLKFARADSPGRLSRALVSLPDFIPDKIWINKLSAGAEGVTINGSTLSNDAIAVFMDKLNKSDKFEDLNFDFMKKSEIGGTILYNFEIRTRIVKE